MKKLYEWPSRLKTLKLLPLLLLTIMSFGVHAQTTITVGTSTTSSGTTDNGNPIYRSSTSSSFNWSISGHVYTATQLAALPSSNSITSFAFNKTSAFGTAAGRNGTLKVYMRNSINTSLPVTTTRAIVEGYTLVYSNTAQTIPSAAGYVTLSLATPFFYSGGSLEIYMDWAGNGGSSDLSDGAFLWQYSTGVAAQTIGNSFGSAFTAFSAYSSSQSRSYNLQLTHIPTAACTGTPSGGTIPSTAAVCSGQPYTLISTGSTSGTSGLAGQWQFRNPAGSGAWVNLIGATESSFTVSSMPSTPTDYRYTLTCGASTGISNVLTTTINPLSSCYCTPIYSDGCEFGDDIDNFSLTGEAGTAINSVATGCSTGAYDIRTAESATLFLGLTYSGAISSNFDDQAAKIWVDFNDNGAFEATETIGTISGFSSTSVPFTVSIPTSATIGNHRMRIRSVYLGTAATIDPCTAESYGETHDYTVNILAPSGCIAPSAVTASSITVNSANLSWTPYTTPPALGYEYYVTTSATVPVASTVPTGSVAAGVTTVSLSSLAGSTTYYFYVRSSCSAADKSSWVSTTFQTLLSNDLPSAATTLTVDAGCTGPTFTNVGGTSSIGEPYPSCSGSGESTVWFKFVAPASGMVRASTDTLIGSNIDTKIAIFSAVNPADFTTFNILSCDEDGGSTINYNSIAYAVGLTPGTTYYVAVDNYNDPFTPGSPGTFCVTVDDITPAMLSTATACDFIDGSDNGFESGYTGWVNLNEADGKLGVLVRNPAGGAPDDFYGEQNINAGGVRTSGTESFIAHNWNISTFGTGTDYQVILIFPTTETTALGTALGSVSVTKVSGAGSACATTFTPYPGDDTSLVPSLTGSANGVDFVQFSTPGFSQFFVHNGTIPLSLSFESIAARNEGASNLVTWKTAGERYGNSFELERSIDGANFSRIATIAARGTASTYDYTDAQPANGINYYRIRIMNGNSQEGYSKVVTATAKTGSFDIAAFPNPTSNDLNIKIAGGITGNALITITDVLGKTVQTINTVSNTMTINMQQFAAGVYFVKYQDDARTQTIKVKKD